MLLEYKVSNFRSIGKDTSLSMEFINSRQKNKDRLNFYDIKDSVYKKVNHTLAILGANASGKSNILESAKAFKHALINDEGNYTYTPNKFCDNLNTTDFDITFYDEDRDSVFNFVLKYNKEGISSEKLSVRPRSSSEFQNIYTIENTTLTINDELINKRTDKRNKDLKEINTDYLFEFNNSKRGAMCFLQGFNKEYKTLNFYRDILNSLSYFTSINVYKNQEQNNKGGLALFIEKHKDTVLSILKENIDDSVTNIKVVDRSNDDNIIVRFINSQTNEILQEMRQGQGIQIFITKTCNGKEVDFEISEESDGTERFLYFVPTVLSILEEGGILLIDEIEQNLHPVLMKKIIDMFKNKDINKGSAQLIFTTHDVSVLDKGVLNIQEVAFSEKENNETDLYYLTDFPIRQSELIRKKYKEGRFGAVPNLVDYLGE